MLKGKNILIGISGGISAYKTYELIRLFRKNNANVKVVLTPNALNFVNLLTLQTLSGGVSYIEQYMTNYHSPEHVSLCDWADLFVIAPITANTIGKIVNGICDNLLTSIVCAFKNKILIAPAMNTGMWENDFVQENIAKLKEKNYEIVYPKVGYLVCGANGIGRMSEADEIFEKAVAVLNGDEKFLQNKKIVITSGGTREKIDAVRYISNFSSGKMGNALAQKAKEFGANVTLITTVKNDLPNDIKIINVESADEMKTACDEEAKDADCVIMAAAVADFKCKNISENKIKKEDDKDEMTLELVKNPDILQELSKNKKDGQKIVGFCAETENLIENAKKKIAQKGCDYIIANDVSRVDTGFSSDNNEVFVIDSMLNVEKIEKDTKINIAKKILEKIFNEQK